MSIAARARRRRRAASARRAVTNKSAGEMAQKTTDGWSKLINGGQGRISCVKLLWRVCRPPKRFFGDVRADPLGVRFFAVYCFHIRTTAAE